MMNLMINSGFIAIMQIIAVLIVIYPIPRRACGKLFFSASSALFVFVSILERVVLSPRNNNNILWLSFELVNFFLICILIRMTTLQHFSECAYLSVWSLCLFQLAFTVTRFFPRWIPFGDSSFDMLAGYPLYIPIYALFALTLSRKLYDPKCLISNRDLIIAIFTHFPINLFNHILFQANNYNVDNQLLVFSTAFAYTCCLFVLYLHYMIIHQSALNQEISIINELWQQRQVQYEVTSNNLAFINKKTHDLMHILAELYHLDDPLERKSLLDEFSSKLELYDAFIETGNQVLDTILSQANIYCKSKGIIFKTMVDSKSIEFINVTDLFTILNNALESAFLYVEQITNPDYRQVFLNIHLKGNLLLICIENEFNPDFTIADNSTYRMKAISYIVKKYEGYLNTSCENARYKLIIVIPKNEL